MPKAAKIAIGVVCAAGVVFCAGSYALDRYLLGQTYARYVPSEPALTLADSDIADGVAACVTMSGFDAPNDIILESARSQMGPIAATQAYLAECAQALGDLQAQYAGEVPDDVLAAFMQSIDKRRANTADPELIGQIDSFLTEAIGENGTEWGDGA